MTLEEFKIWFDGLIAGMPKPENVCSYNVYHDLIIKIKEKIDSVESMEFYGFDPDACYDVSKDGDGHAIKIDTRTGKPAL